MRNGKRMGNLSYKHKTGTSLFWFVYWGTSVKPWVLCLWTPCSVSRAYPVSSLNINYIFYAPLIMNQNLQINYHQPKYWVVGESGFFFFWGKILDSKFMNRKRNTVKELTSLHDFKLEWFQQNCLKDEDFITYII